jgi:hypothetical protein
MSNAIASSHSPSQINTVNPCLVWTDDAAVSEVKNNLQSEMARRSLYLNRSPGEYYNSYFSSIKLARLFSETGRCSDNATLNAHLHAILDTSNRLFFGGALVEGIEWRWSQVCIFLEHVAHLRIIQ